MQRLLLAWILFAASPALVAAQPFSAATLEKERLQSLLQRFVDHGYGKTFRHLGDERDFDHGHVLIDAKSRRPIAILYHTQELASEAAAPSFGYLDAQARNWLQWIDGGAIENARRYARVDYPHTPGWDWFVQRELPRLRQRHTITDKMLDPRLLGAELAESVQWVFTREPCTGVSAESDAINVTLPDGGGVCLALSSS